MDVSWVSPENPGGLNHGMMAGDFCCGEDHESNGIVVLLK
jgi:hypothetical protein